MLSDAFALALLTTAGAMMVYKKLPSKVKRFLEKHALMTDLVSLVLTYLLLGGTLTALAAGAMVGIFVSGLLHIANNKEDFLYLFDFIDACKAQLASLNKTLSEFGKEYRLRKEILAAGGHPNAASL